MWKVGQKYFQTPNTRKHGTKYTCIATDGQKGWLRSEAGLDIIRVYDVGLWAKEPSIEDVFNVGRTYLIWFRNHEGSDPAIRRVEQVDSEHQHVGFYGHNFHWRLEELKEVRLVWPDECKLCWAAE